MRNYRNYELNFFNSARSSFDFNRGREKRRRFVPEIGENNRSHASGRGSRGLFEDQSPANTQGNTNTKAPSENTTTDI